MTSSPRLEIPSDLFHEILKHIPSTHTTVLIYHRRSPAWSIVKVRKDHLDEKERQWLKLEEDDDDWWSQCYHHHGNCTDHVTELVHRALAIGFKFPDQESRRCSVDMLDFEMERKPGV